MRAKAPTDRRGDRSKTIAMSPEPIRIGIADAFDPADNDLFAVLHTLEADSPIEGQIFLRRICYLQQVAFEPGGGKAGDRCIDRVERRQEVANQDELARARQRLEGGQAVRFRRLATDQLGNPRQRDVPVHRRDAAAK